MTTATPTSLLTDLTAHQRAALKLQAANLAARRLTNHLLARSFGHPSERAAELLFTLTLKVIQSGDFSRSFEPLELGGSTKSHHSADLSSLATLGLVERTNRNFIFDRPSYLYRPALNAGLIQGTFASEFANLEEVKAAALTESPAV